VQRGEIIDAATSELSGREALLEMLRWKSGNFEMLASDIPRPRTIFSSYESLLMETAQTIDETQAEAPGAETAGLAAFARYKGVQFAVAVDSADKSKFDQWGCEDAEQIAAWILETGGALRDLGDKLEAGQLTDLEALGPQRHLALLCGDREFLGVGFTRSAMLPHVRETMKQIEHRWAT
jgi:hypothetical protein